MTVGHVCHHEHMDQEAVQRISAAMPDVRQVLEDAEGPVGEQHTVSKVLLKQFAGHGGRDNRRIIPFSLEYPDSRHRSKSPRECGKVPDFVKFGSGHLERHVWKPIEDALPDALAAVDDRTVFDRPEHVATIKNAIILHFVRSTQIRDLQRDIWPHLVARKREWWLSSGATLLNHGYRLHHGLYPGSVQERQRFLEERLQLWLDAAESELLFDARLEALFHQGCEMVADFGLEILTPERGQFLIGDVPALTVRHDRNKAGVRNGIALGDAHSVVLPLGPRRLAAFGPVNGYGTIPVDLRNRLNGIQVQGADRYVYFRPGSGLEEFVRSQPRIRAVSRGVGRQGFSAA